jgi:hypothetical protein
LVNRLNSEALNTAWECELLHVVGRIEDSDGGEVGFFNSNELTESLLDAISNA